MPATRTNKAEQLARAVDDLTSIAARSAGLSISATAADDRVSIELAGTSPWKAELHTRSSLSPNEAQALVASEDTPGAHLVVADQIAAGAKEHLAKVPDWGWLDRRSELRLRNGGFMVEIRLPPGGLNPLSSARMALAAPAGDSPIRGRAGISYAAALLRGDPGGPPSIRAVARQVGMAASTFSEAVGHLRDAGLIRPNGKPELPDLFWALAAVWRPLRASPVATRPVPADLASLSPNVDDLAAEGWAQGGDEAALAWGAPMFLVGSRPWIWVPNQVAARRAERALGSATWDDHAGIIAVPPTPLVCMNRHVASSTELDWPTPHPLYLALDLAQDPGRGREILEGWNPPMPVPRPWAPAE